MAYWILPCRAKRSGGRLPRVWAAPVGNGHRVLEHLYERPIIAVEDVKALTGTTYSAANQLVERLAELGVIAEFTGQRRNRRFRYDAYVELFGDGERATAERPG